MRANLSVLLIVVMAVVLIACGGTNSIDDNVVDNTGTPDNSKVHTPVTEPENPDVNGKPAATMDIVLEVEGNVETRTGTLAMSDNGYYLYTLPQFIFTPEEPNADQVYMDKFEDYYMRILTLGEEPDLTEVRNQAEVELAMLGEVVEMKDEEIWEPALRDSVLYLHASDATLSKYIIVREIEGKYLKVIVNIPNGEAQEGAGPSFPAMIKTIGITKS